LGVHGTPEAESNYLRAKAHFLLTGELPEDLLKPKRARKKGVVPPAPVLGQVTIEDLLLAFYKYAEAYYVKGGKQTSEVHCLKSATKLLRKMYGGMPVDDFGPLALQAVRAGMIEEKWARGTINKNVSRIRSVFRWGVANEMVRPDTLAALEAVQGLRAGRTEAHDNPERRPVPQEHIDKVKAVVPERTADLIDLMLLTASRPGEVLGLTTAMIDRTGDVWTATLVDHKTQHHGLQRTLFFGPLCQVILKKYLNLKKPDERIFKLRRDTLSKAIKDACEKQKIEPAWTPHWLRHTALTRVRKEAGTDVAQLLAGHSQIAMTEKYAKPDLSVAVRYVSVAG